MVMIVAPADLEAARLNFFWHNRMQEKLTPIKAAGRFGIHPRKVSAPRWLLQHRQRRRRGGRRKRAIERREILLREAERERSVILPHMRNVGRLWNGNNAVLPEQPSERDLSGLCVVSSRYAFQRSMTKQPPLLDRRISHDRDASLAAPRQQIVLDAAPCQVVENLVGRNVRAAGESPKLDHVHRRRNC